MAVPFLDFKAANEHLLDDYYEQQKKIFESGQYILGPAVQKFEEQFARYVSVRHGIGVNSGTDALVLSLKACGVGPGDEVICPAFAPAACASAIMQLGAIPALVEVRSESFCLDPDICLSTITPKTKAILVLHMFGLSAEIDRLSTIARTYSVQVVEDMRHAAGARHNNRRLGSYGAATAFSFYPTRPLGALGDAGMVVTSDERVHDVVRKLRSDDCDVDASGQPLAGCASRMDAMQAAFLSLKLPDLDENNWERVENARLYNQLFEGSAVQAPIFRDDQSHVYGHYTILAPERDKLAAHLEEKGIGHGIYYRTPLHLLPALAHLNYKEGAFPVAEDIARRAISLPICPGLKKHQIEEVAATVNAFYGVTA